MANDGKDVSELEMHKLCFTQDFDSDESENEMAVGKDAIYI